MRHVSLYIVFLLSLWFAGCATSKTERSQHHRADQKFTFKTKLTVTNFSFAGDGLSKPAQIRYQVRAHCKGLNCIPDKAELSFFLESGRNSVYLSNRDLTIRAGKEKYHWDGLQTPHDIRDSQPVIGNIISVDLKSDTLQHLAHTQKVTGILAAHSFKWSYANRAPIRKMLAEMDSTAVKDD